MEVVQKIQITPQQLVEAIGIAVKEQLEKRLPKLKEEESLLTKKEAASFLSISMSTLGLWCRKGLLNSFGIGGRVYFKQSEIMSSLISLNN
jgi:hypothetical protein